MRRSSSVALSVLTAIALAGVTNSGTARAGSSPLATATHSPIADLAVTGEVAGGEQSVESFHPVVFVFTLKNKGPNTVDSSADMGYTQVLNGTVTDQLCVFPDGRSFNADSPACEYGSLGTGQLARMVLILQPLSNVTNVSLTVRVCSSNESGIPDPVSGNDCTTLGVRY
jgi:hypothetical protein